LNFENENRTLWFEPARASRPGGKKIVGGLSQPGALIDLYLTKKK